MNLKVPLTVSSQNTKLHLIVNDSNFSWCQVSTYSRVEKKKKNSHIVKKRIQNKTENKNIKYNIQLPSIGTFWTVGLQETLSKVKHKSAGTKGLKG